MGIKYIYEYACYITPMRMLPQFTFPIYVRDITILMDIDPMRRDCAVKR